MNASEIKVVGNDANDASNPDTNASIFKADDDFCNRLMFGRLSI